MYLPSSLFILCFCLSFYVCTARPLVALDDKVCGKVHENAKKHGAESKGEGIKVEGIGWETRATEKSKPTVGVHLKDVKRAKEEEEFSGMGLARSEVSKFCHVGLFKATSVKGPRRRAISAVSPAEVKQNVDGQEDIEVKDYEAPHQTPPIHNRQT